MTSRALRIFTAAAGLVDASTGLGLVAAPAFTLRAMLAPVPASPEAIVFVRFLGAFVFGVGISYLTTLRRWTSARARAMFGTTAIIRACVGLFVLTSVAVAALSWPWLSVALADLSLAALQWRWMRDLA